MNLIETYKQDLLSSIPVVEAMNINIVEIKPRNLVISAPLSTNINYEGTAFGGSLNTVCVLSCYLLVHHILKQEEIKHQSLVIQNSTINYKKPVADDFLAVSSVSEVEYSKFIRMIKTKEIARIETAACIQTVRNDFDLVDFKARFVARR